MTINIIHVLSNVVKISSNVKKIAIFSQFLKILKNILAYNSKTVIATNLGLVTYSKDNRIYIIATNYVINIFS